MAAATACARSAVAASGGSANATRRPASPIGSKVGDPDVDVPIAPGSVIERPGADPDPGGAQRGDDGPGNPYGVRAVAMDADRVRLDQQSRPIAGGRRMVTSDCDCLARRLGRIEQGARPLTRAEGSVRLVTPIR